MSKALVQGAYRGRMRLGTKITEMDAIAPPDAGQYRSLSDFELPAGCAGVLLF
jgi:hypothetical protein